MGIYIENIIDLYKNPLNQGKLKNPSAKHRAYNPLCGDDITVYLNIRNNKIEDVKQEGIGCAISQASISLLTERIKGKSTKEVMKIKPEEVIKMLGVDLGPVRLKCALLGLEAVHQAIARHQSTNAYE